MNSLNNNENCVLNILRVKKLKHGKYYIYPLLFIT